ncbi:MAG: 16S rRNA (cytosine(1402)-N(4))-methyltransferase RsmH [Candidatus Ancillula sp.]|jgi:16S rRNA (cytosine1402-N4)-methyltransferase|nr:16S rRNA (cytosine(1402)-N(4))-methyltransferase RsmH [Candidatus Ancillula sp.]
MSSTSLHETDFEHIPVMLSEVIEALSPALERNSAVLYDLTLGLGGHTSAFLTEFPNILVFGVDRDYAALERATARLSTFGPRFRGFNCRYDELNAVIAQTGCSPTAILMDLGVSSMQLDDPSRGFAYSKDEALDMRMNQSTGQTAAELIGELEVEELASILKEFGEEKHSGLVAQSIKKVLPTTTSQLADAIRLGLPKQLQNTEYKMSAIKRVFQALRIAVNCELESLESALDCALNSLEVGGRIAILTYHSLEDRIVKKRFNLGTSQHCASLLPREIPLQNLDQLGYLDVLVKGVAPSANEQETNPRSRSARLRVAQKTADVNTSTQGVSNA